MSDETMASAVSETEGMAQRHDEPAQLDFFEEPADDVQGKAEAPKRKTSSAQKRFDELTRARYDAERDRDLWRQAYFDATGEGVDGAAGTEGAPPYALQDAGERILGADRQAFDILRSLPTLSEETAIAIADADNPGQLARWFGTNPDEATRLAGLPATKVGREIAKIEARLSQSTSKRVSNAPPPPKSVKGTGTGVQKTPEQMSYAEYKEYRNHQERAKL